MFLLTWFPVLSGTLDPGNFSSKKLLNAPAGLIPEFDCQRRLRRFRNLGRLAQNISTDFTDIIALVFGFHSLVLEIC